MDKPQPQRDYVITDAMVAGRESEFDWLKLAHEWGHELRTPRGRLHWEAQFHCIGECLAYPRDYPLRVLELCPGSGLIIQALVQHYPQLVPAIMELQPIFKRIAGANVQSCCRHEPLVFAADLRDGDWTDSFGDHVFDVIVTSDALNGLNRHGLRQAYNGIHGLLEPGGVLFNCDRVGSRDPQCQAVFDRARETVFGRNPNGWQRIKEWWNAIGERFGVDDYATKWLAELSDPDCIGLAGLPADEHIAMLHDAGFAGADCIWHYLGDGVLMGVAAEGRFCTRHRDHGGG